ncbi:MAG: hypothetical protein A4E68_01744 [Syntrophaceae bacterium PtaB.Bin095]|nr:MAG: hypothetical protein A4E68_01744 [Syntrophaceae bacterium PtaB.Bin095]
MRRRYRPARLEKMGDILQKVLRKHRIPVQTADQGLRKTWMDAVGPKIAAYTRPEAVRRNVLFIKVANSVWMQQLHFLKQDILEKINRANAQNPIQNIFFSLDETAVPAPETKRPQAPEQAASALRSRDRILIEKSVAAIADTELRDILQRVMTREIARRRRIESEARRPRGRDSR